MNSRALILGLTFLAALSCSHDALARGGGVIFVADVSDAASARVIDTRNRESCVEASLPRARCLPANNFMGPDGKTIGFHALRWLLGTVGLNGSENVLVIGADSQDAMTIGMLIGRAGQQSVHVFDAPFVASDGAVGGEQRSLSREVVFTAPMHGTDARPREP